jgi:hypothetical protein
MGLDMRASSLELGMIMNSPFLTLKSHGHADIEYLSLLRSVNLRKQQKRKRVN